ncbi:MAG: G5 domain-containing protein [Oscillospiraceae bacterium]|nr:G5 domain-containing protein [Oscillospiraceae bacterium]
MKQYCMEWMRSQRRSLSALMTLVICVTLLSATFTYANAWDTASAAFFAPQDLAGRVFFTGLGENSPEDYRFENGEKLSLQRHELAIPVFAEDETIAELLFRLDIQVGDEEAVLVDFSSGVPSITIDDSFVCEVEHVVADPCVTRYEPNSSLAWGEEVVAQEGADGVIPHTYRVRVEDGKITSSLHLSTGESTMQERVIQYGTRTRHAKVKVLDYEGGTINVNGEELSYSKSLRMIGTAYTAGIGVVNNITATGTQVRVGVVAVDKRVIPLGTKLFIEAANGSYIYGTAVAEDTGVRGNVIDLYMNSYEDCVRFGRRDVNVYILD